MKNCKKCEKEFHFCSNCELDASTHPQYLGYCSWICFLESKIDDPDELEEHDVQMLILYTLSIIS